MITYSELDVPIYIGFDHREPEAFEVCRYSILKYCPNARVFQLDHKNLSYYHRPDDPLATTEFCYTRFLVPHISGYKGMAMFVDCDFLFREPISHLLDHINPLYALSCVHHDYRPTETTKMDNKPQTQYPRKNWSSLMIFNCEHSANRSLTPYVVNTHSGAYLHRFQWLLDAQIGHLPNRWNWLEGWDKSPNPAAVHYTRGGPWFPNCQDVDYADEWLQTYKEFGNNSLLMENYS